MTIKDHFRRALHKSNSSSTLDSNPASAYTATIAATPSNGSHSDMSATTSSGSDNARRHSLHLSRALTWVRGERDHPSRVEQEKEKLRLQKEADKKAKSAAAAKRRKKPTHPSEKTLTAQNLRHQEMLSQFSWTDALRAEHFGPGSVGGVSPCCTRPTSMVFAPEAAS